MIVAEATLRQLVEGHAKQSNITLERMAREADMSWSQFHTVLDNGFSNGTRWGTIKKFARVLGKDTAELIRLVDD